MYTKGTVLLVCFQCIDTLVFVLKHAEGMSLCCDVVCALAYCGWHESLHIIKAHTDCTDLTGFLCGWEISRMDWPSLGEGLPTTQQAQQDEGFNESWDAEVWFCESFNSWKFVWIRVRKIPLASIAILIRYFLGWWLCSRYLGRLLWKLRGI